MCIAYTMEAYDRGLVTREELDGIDLTWGNSEAVVEVIHKIAKRDGIGGILAEGTERMAKGWLNGRSGINGEKPEDFLLAVKGLEYPMHMPRGKKGLGLTYATSARGADHCDGLHDPMCEEYGLYPDLGLGNIKHDRFEVVGKPFVVMKVQDRWAAVNCMILCLSVTEPSGPITVREQSELLTAVTGVDYNIEEVQKVGERSWNLARLFNLRLGMDRKSDTLPPRMGESMLSGASKGQVITEEDMNLMLDDYYALRGWSENGIPTIEKLEELELDFKR